MQDSIVKVAGRDTLYYAPSKPTQNVVVALHGVGETTFDQLRTRGLGKAAAVSDIDAHIYLPLWPGGYFPIDGLLVPLETALCAKHGIDGITLGTGLSSGGNVILQWLCSGKAKMKNCVPVSTNSSQSNVLGLIHQATETNLWHLHGETDPDPNKLITTEKFIVEYNKRFPGKAKRSVFDNVGHNAWDITYGSKLSQPTVPGPSPLYEPFDKSIWDWAFGPTIPTDPDPDPEPTKDQIVDFYELGGEVIAVTASGKSIKIAKA